MSAQEGALLRLMPRQLPLLLAIVCFGVTLGHLISVETPVGEIDGQIFLTDTRRPLDKVRVTLYPKDWSGMSGLTRHAVSGVNGQFKLFHIPEGDYTLSASTYAHEVHDATVHVDEGHVTPVSLGLQRSMPNFQVVVHQRVFGSAEQAHLSIRGYVDSKGLPHQDRCQLSIYRTKLSNLLGDRGATQGLQEVGRGFDAAPTLPPSLLKPKHGTEPTHLEDRDIRLVDEDREGFYYHKIGLGKLKTGLYLLSLKHEKDTGCAWLLVTDSALVIKRSGQQMVAFAADMNSGHPIVGGVVRTYRRGAVIAQGRTDRRGLAELNVSAAPTHDGSDWQSITVVERGDDESVINQDNSEEEEKEQYVVHAYTDRTIYRPGQRIQFKAIVRKSLPQHSDTGLSEPNIPLPAPGARYGVPAGVSVEVELLDPKGDSTLRQTLRTNGYGSLFGSVDLPAEATTGVYTLKLHIDDEEHTHEIVVASYRKPEYAVTVTPDRPRYTRGDDVTMTISAQYYFGAPVAGQKVDYNVYSSPDWAAEYPDDYEYSDAEDSQPAYTHYRGDGYYGATITSGSTMLDADGKAVIHFRATSENDDQNGPQEWIYTCHASVSESVNQPVEGDGQARVTAGDFRLTLDPEGYVAAPKQTTQIILVARDHDGNPVPNVPVDLEMAYESWADGAYHKSKVGDVRAVTGADGRAALPVTPPHNGNLELTAHAEDGEHHRILGRTSLWVASDAGGDLDTTYDDLSLLTDKRRYSPGDTARVLINSDHLGETLLLTIEGDRVYRTQTLQIEQHSTVVRVPVRAQYGPNVFLAACYVRNKHFAQSSLPLRVSLPSGDLHLTVTADRQSISADSKLKSQAPYAPGDRITYHVTAADDQGRPARCEFSLGVVDESIYALQEDDPSALRNTFYPRRTNSVNTIYSFAAEYLGDADKAEPKISARKRFPDTAFWNPVLLTDEHGQATISFALPDNLTTWRATVVAHTLDTRVGRAVTKVIVTKPFLVRVETPRTLTQRDQSQITALVHNDTAQPQTAYVRLRTDSTLPFTGETTQTLSLAPGSMGEAHWPVTAEGYGTAKLKVTAWTRPVSGAQLTDGVETSLPIRPFGREEVTTLAGELTAARPEAEVVRVGPEVVPGTARMVIRVTPSIAAALTGGVEYLTGFPYGCVEQTMSRLLPDLLVQRALRQKGVANLPNAAQLPEMVRESLLRLYRFQHESGAWGWWEHDEDDVWMTAYVLYGLTTARAQGYPVSQRAFDLGRKAAIKMIGKSRLNDQAFLMYALALTGDRDAARSIRKNLNLSLLSTEALGYVALTDHLIGGGNHTALAALNQRTVAESSTVHWENQSRYDFEDSWSATASALRALLAWNPQDPRIEPTLRWLMLKRTGGYWEDTRDTAWVLTALCDYLDHQSGHIAGGAVQISLNGQAVQTLSLADSDREAHDLVLYLPASRLKPGKNEVVFTRQRGSEPVFYTVELHQTADVSAPPPAAMPGLVVKREYYRVDSKQDKDGVWRLSEQQTGNRFEGGEHVRIRLTLEVPRDMDYVLIDDPFPAGCEVNERGDADEATDWSFWWSSIDIRDDRIAFFARTLTKGEHVIEYNLRAQTPGSYHALPTLVQAMYAPELRAETPTHQVTVH